MPASATAGSRLTRTLERLLDALTPRSLRLTLALLVGLMACLPVAAWHDGLRGLEADDPKGPRVTQATLVAPTTSTAAASPLPLPRPTPAVISPAGLDLHGLAWLYGALVTMALLLALGALRRLRAFRVAVETAVLQRSDDGILARHRPPAELAPVAQVVDRLMGDFHYMAGQMRAVADDGAHAMRTPLATVATALHSIRRHLPADDVRAQRTMRIIDLSIDRLSQLVDATQVQGQSIAALVAAPRQRLDFAAVVDAAIGRAGVEAAERRIALRFERADGPACVLANPEALEIAVRDLLLSALDSSPEDAAVDVTLGADHAAVTLVVADAGHDDFDVSLLFEQAPALLAPEGQPTPRWPGLSGVRRTVEVMGGTITAWRNLAGGVSVSLSLPTSSAG